MKLQLKYKTTIQQPTTALLIKGEDPRIWLQTINSWQVKVQNLACYLLPASKGDIRAVGLLVLFSGTLPKWEDAAEVAAYGQVSDRLWIPVDAVLVPAIEAAELAQQLLYDRQLFHPRIGLIGFNKADQVVIADLLQFPEEDIADWGQAAEGVSNIPDLTQIQMPPIPPKELIASLKQDIGSKPLEDIPGVTKEKEGLGKDLKDMFKKAALKGGIGMAGAMLHALSSENGQRDPALFNKFMNWAGNQLDALENKRNQEMDRLMDLFNGDVDEALKYAIPLDSAYQNRGQAPPSSNLSERSTDFNLGQLGGGGQGDAWTSGKHYFNLRGKYIEAAKQKIAEGDFRKAAYIYAHLLGDFRAAANVLEQGGFYREAAALYVEHVKDKNAAAKCLEKGGLLYEAIDLYKELNKQEKVGDLYTQLEQWEAAEKSYGKAISQALLRKDYLKASFILSDKLQDIPKAKKVLLDGWKQTNKAEGNLRRYFDLTELPDLAREVQSVYQDHTFPENKNHFLNVLLYLKDRRAAPQLDNTARELAYQIIGEQVKQGTTNRLADLPKFVQTDKLLSTDVNRFTAKNNRKKNVAPHKLDVYLFRKIILDRNVVWEKTSTYNNQFLVLGTSNGKLHFVRGNYLGDKDHHSWSTTLPAYTNFQFVEKEQDSGPVFFYSAGQIDLENTIIPKSSSFPADLHLNCLNWLPDNTKGIAKVGENEIGVLAADNIGNAQLYFYDDNGFLKHSKPCMLGAEGLNLYNTIISSFHYRNSCFYFITENNGQVLQMDKDGAVKTYWSERPAKMIAMINKNAGPRVAIFTEYGIKILHPLGLSTSYFGQGSKPSAMAFIPRLGLVVTKRNQVFIFGEEVSDMEFRASLLHSFKITGRSTIISIVPLSGGKCGFLTNEGELLVYAFR